MNYGLNIYDVDYMEMPFDVWSKAASEAFIICWPEVDASAVFGSKQ